MKRSTLEVWVAGLVVAVSGSWIVDSGSAGLKLAVYACLAGVLLVLGLGSHVRPLSRNDLPVLLLASGVAVIGLIHGRGEDISIVLKLAVALVLCKLMSPPRFATALATFSRWLFPVTVLGYACSLSGIDMAIPTHLIAPDGKPYFITPFLTVARDRDVSRCASIFWEPGVLAAFSNIVMALRLFVLRQKWSDCWREMAAIALSMSAGGVLCLVLLGLAWASANHRTWRPVGYVVFAGLSVSLVAADLHFIDPVRTGLSAITGPVLGRDLQQDESFSARAIDLVVPHVAARESPWIGHGNLDAYQAVSEQARGYAARIITNSISIIAYGYGYLLLGLYLCLLLRISIRSNGLIPPMVVVFLVAVLMVEPLHFSPLVLYLLSALPQRKRVFRNYARPAHFNHYRQL